MSNDDSDLLGVSPGACSKSPPSTVKLSIPVGLLTIVLLNVHFFRTKFDFLIQKKDFGQALMLSDNLVSISK